MKRKCCIDNCHQFWKYDPQGIWCLYVTLFEIRSPLESFFLSNNGDFIRSPTISLVLLLSCNVATHILQIFLEWNVRMNLYKELLGGFYTCSKMKLIYPCKELLRLKSWYMVGLSCQWFSVVLQMFLFSPVLSDFFPKLFWMLFFPFFSSKFYVVYILSWNCQSNCTFKDLEAQFFITCLSECLFETMAMLLSILHNSVVLSSESE